MFGNGVRTGMVATAAVLRRILPARHRALTACSVVAVGAAMRGSAGCRLATTARLASRSTTSACASPSSSLLQKKKRENIRQRRLTCQKRRAKAAKGKVSFYYLFFSCIFARNKFNYCPFGSQTK